MKDTLENGPGFWLKFDSAETLPIDGDMLFNDAIDVYAGWNMVGSLTEPIAASTIETDPQGRIVSDIYRYNPGVGYQSVDTLQPGVGYWVKVDHDGKVYRSANPNTDLFPLSRSILYIRKSGREERGTGHMEQWFILDFC